MKEIIIENIADLHFGKTGKEEKLYESLKNGFIKYCNSIKPDLIIINGDSYDSRQLINSQANIFFNKFIRDCIDTGAIIVILEGTESHDRYQINALAHYISDKFYIINTATKLTLLGLKFLFLPEEYVKDNTYYDKYLEDYYDFVNFHGMFSHVGFDVQAKNDEIVRHSFTFNYKMFQNNVKYYVIGGHIHTHSIYKNIIYCGSYPRLNFGEEEDKGWIEVKLKNNKCSWKFIKNEEAMTFTTILASNLPNDVEKLLYQLRGYQENNDFLRIHLDIDDEEKNNNIIGFVKMHDNCCIKRQKIAKKDVDNKEIADNLKEKQDILNKRLNSFKNMDFIQITQKIAKDEYQQNFEREEINNILNTQI